jgi:hypothetical protein
MGPTVCRRQSDPFRPSIGVGIASDPERCVEMKTIIGLAP